MGAEFCRVPEDGAAEVRRGFGLAAGDPLRISYIAGPGDVAGTWRYWRDGKTDPRVPVVTYTAMFCEVAHKLQAQAQILTPVDFGDAGDDRFRFDLIERPAWETRRDYFRSLKTRVDSVKTAIASFAPHVVVAHSDFPSAGWPELRVPGRRLILSAHNTYWSMGRVPRHPLALARLMQLNRHSRSLDGAVCTSEECRRQLHLLTRGAIDGAVEIPQLETPFPPSDRQGPCRRFLYLGRIEPSKGVFRLLEAFRAVRARHPDVTLSMAGAGSATEALSAAVAEVTGARFLGMLDAAEVHGEIARSDLLVCPTDRAFQEGLALVCIEAAAHGVPSLVSSVVPARDLLGAAAEVYRADDTADLTEKLTALVEDDGRHRALSDATADIRARLYDRSLSWGSRLYGEIARA